MIHALTISIYTIHTHDMPVAAAAAAGPPVALTLSFGILILNASSRTLFGPLSIPRGPAFHPGPFRSLVDALAPGPNWTFGLPG